MRQETSGQIVIVLLLIIVVALAIGLSISTRSIRDISTATRTEQSARAFSAAEAGIEKALLRNDAQITVPLPNSSQAVVASSPLLPQANEALEYPPVDRATIAQFWLASPTDLSAYYTQPSFELYFGNSGQAVSNDNPAVEVNVITYDTASGYRSNRYFYDSLSTRVGSNKFNDCSVGPNPPPAGITTTLYSPSATSGGSSFYCKVLVPPAGGYTGTPVMARARILYSEAPQKVALKPIGNCGQDCSLPPQGRLYTSTGTSGNVQRRVQLFKLDYVVPPLLDYVLFSAGEITKN